MERSRRDERRELKCKRFENNIKQEKQPPTQKGGIFLLTPPPPRATAHPKPDAGLPTPPHPVAALGASCFPPEAGGGMRPAARERLLSPAGKGRLPVSIWLQPSRCCESPGLPPASPPVSGQCGNPQGSALPKTRDVGIGNGGAGSGLRPCLDGVGGRG